MGIVTLLLLIAGICSGMAAIIKVMVDGKKDESPKIGEGFMDNFLNLFKHED